MTKKQEQILFVFCQKAGKDTLKKIELMSKPFTHLTKTIATIAAITIASSPVFAETSPTKTLKVKLDGSGLGVDTLLLHGVPGLINSKSRDWVRLELDNNLVKVIHTTRVQNGFTLFNKWWDHQVRNIVFKPDYCSFDRCFITSSNDTIQMENPSQIFQGEFRIEYFENNQWKTSVFRVPCTKDNGCNLDESARVF